eukprot:scaffold6352_cov67-Phaeocystis_antarctica.AAC.9
MGPICATISSYLDCDHATLSIWLTATNSCETPRLRASSRCSRVCAHRPASKAPVDALSTSSAASACAAPPIMFGTKSWWPGASSTLTSRRGVRKKAQPTSMVTPLARSSASWSMTHA